MGELPEICGYYSITEDGNFEESTSSLQYFIKPKLPINLNKGIENVRAKTYYERKDNEMGHILRFIANHKQTFLNQSESLQQGVLNRACTVFATKYRGDIYLRDYAEWDETGDQGTSDPPWKKVRKVFKHRCLSDHPNQRSRVYDEGKKFFCVFKRDLVNRQFLFSAQMEGIDSETPLDLEEKERLKPNQFIALKLYNELNSQKKKSKFENGMIHVLWAYCYLVGIEKVHIGFKNYFGTLKEMRCHSIDELAEISKRNWSDSMDGFEFLNFFLGEVENDLKDVDCPYTTISFHYDPKTKSVTSTKYENKTEHSFLPEWYLKEINNDT